MKLAQVSIFLENNKGRILEVCKTLGANQINILALTVAESREFGVLRMVVSDTAKALQLLKAQGFTASQTDIVGVEVSDQPGGLATVLKVLDANNLNVEYMYGFVEKSSDQALMVFRFDDPDKAVQILQKNGISILTTWKK